MNSAIGYSEGAEVPEDKTMNGKQFEKVLDMAEENVQLKRSLKEVLSILDTYGNIEILLPMKDRLKLIKARGIIAPK